MRLISSSNLVRGMKVAEPVYGAAGQLLLRPGVTLTDRYIHFLHKQGLPAVYIEDPDTDDVLAPQPIRETTRHAAREQLQEVFYFFAPGAKRLRNLSLSLTKKHISTERFAQAVQSAFGPRAFDGIGRSVDAIIADLLNEDVLVGLNSIKCHDTYTFQHSIDVTIMGLVLARKAGWPQDRQRTFGIGCLLHDLGKVLIAAHILNKPETLTAEECEQVKAHPLLGYQMIKAVNPDRFTLMAQVAYQHHERQDGKGYPRGLKGTNRLGHEPGHIHEFGSIAAVADVYDAMSSTRPYRDAWAPDRVVASIAAAAGDQLNREAVELFLAAVAPYPKCSEVLLLSGAYSGYTAVVTHVPPQQLNRPVIRVLHDAKGTRIEPFEIDLRSELDVQIRSLRTREPEPSSMRHRKSAQVMTPSATPQLGAGDAVVPAKLAS